MVKISNLPDGGDQESGDVLPGVRGGTTQKVSGPLVQSDLAANGGSVPEVDRSNEWQARQEFNYIGETSFFDPYPNGRYAKTETIDVSTFSFSGIFNEGSTTHAFNYQISGGADSGSSNLNAIVFSFGTADNFLTLEGGRGAAMGDPVGGVPAQKGALNAEALFYNNYRVLAPGNTAGGDLPTSDPAVAGQLWNDGGTVKVSSG